jgi:hypothetical protein
MKKLLTSILSLISIASVAQPILVEGSAVAGIDHLAIACDIDMPGQGGAAWFDYNQDGWYDLYLTGGCNRDALYKNNGDGSFSDVTEDAGLNVLSLIETDGVTTGDVNRDGFPDILVTTFKSASNYLLINNGDGTFISGQWAGVADTANSFSAAFGDFNMDSWLDLYVCNWSTNFQITVDGPIVSVDSKPNYFYQNNGNGTFTERAEQSAIGDSLGCALGVLFTDFDGDQDSDILIANDLGYFNGNSSNRLYLNQHPQNEFTEESSTWNLNLEMNGMGMAKSDIDLDGQFDYFITNIGNDKLMVHGLAGFEDQSIERGIKNDSVWVDDLSGKVPSVGWGAAFMDLDNDMDEDLMVANGSLGYGPFLPALDSNKLYLNDGTGNFTDISRETGVFDTYVSRALAYCDFNLDGNLDVFVGITDEQEGTRRSMLYKNLSPSQNWIQVKAVGTQSNLEGIGAVIRVYTHGVVQTREIGGESSFNSQHWRVAHFGLGTHTEIDSIEVYWLGGDMDSHYDPQINQMITLTQGDGTVTGSTDPTKDELSVYPNPFLDAIQLNTKKGSQYQLLDAKGALVLSFTAEKDEVHRINTAILVSGSYLLVSTDSGGNIVTRRLVKQ